MPSVHRVLEIGKQMENILLKCKRVGIYLSLFVRIQIRIKVLKLLCFYLTN